MPKLKREYSIALMIIGALVLLYFGINYLKGLNILSRKNVFHAVYKDVSGINDASPVLFKGMKVGQVIGTELMPDGSGRIVVSFQLSERRLALPADSRAEIYSADLFTRAIQIVLGDSAVLANAGDTLDGGAQLSLTESFAGELDPLKRKAEGMLSSVDSVLTAMQNVLNTGARKDIDASFMNLRAALENVKGTTERINQLLDDERSAIRITLDNLSKVSGTLANNADEINRIFSHVDSITAALGDGRLEKMIAGLSATSDQLKQVMTSVNEGRGTLGKLVKDDSLYVNLNKATKDLDMLLEDLRVNPNRYLSIFGKKDKLPKLSDADIERIQQAYQKQHKP